jgi:hypothetical protein
MFKMSDKWKAAASQDSISLCIARHCGDRTQNEYYDNCAQHCYDKHSKGLSNGGSFFKKTKPTYEDEKWRDEYQRSKPPVMSDPYPDGEPLGGGAPLKPRKGTYESMTVPELQERCKKYKIKTTGLRKAELISALRARQGSLAR